MSNRETLEIKFSKQDVDAAYEFANNTFGDVIEICKPFADVAAFSYLFGAVAGANNTFKRILSL